jgi:predicted SprT family Zn-dependent metalloprotease
MALNAVAAELIAPYQDRIAYWAQTWALPDLPDQVTIEISNRLRTSIGLCYPARKLIRLHPVVRELDEPLLLEILCHELAHVAVYLHHGREAKPHGPEWADLVRAAGFDPRARLPHGSIFNTPARRATQRTVLWHHRCPRCNAGRTARRPVYAWRCATCHRNGHDGHLHITREEVAG